jgi:hypothetical protein
MLEQGKSVNSVSLKANWITDSFINKKLLKKMKSQRFVKEWLDHFQRLVKEKVTVNETVTSCHMNKRVLSPTDQKGGIKNTDHFVRLLAYLSMKQSEKQFMEFWMSLGKWTYQLFDNHGDEALQFYARKGESRQKAEERGLKADGRSQM